MPLCGVNSCVGGRNHRMQQSEDKVRDNQNETFISAQEERFLYRLAYSLNPSRWEAILNPKSASNFNKGGSKL